VSAAVVSWTSVLETKQSENVQLYEAPQKASALKYRSRFDKARPVD